MSLIFNRLDETNRIVYDDSAIDRLLNRNLGEEGGGIAEQSVVNEGINEYLSSFKVAFYQVKEADEEEEEEERKV